jgi:hypothetical protein
MAKKRASRARRQAVSRTARKAPKRPAGRRKVTKQARKRRRRPSQTRSAARKAFKRPGETKRPVRVRRPVAARRQAKRTVAAKPPVQAKRSVPPAKLVKVKAPAAPRKASPPVPARLERARRLLSDAEREAQSPTADARLLSSARAGHDELDAMLRRHTETSPALTAGDIDAKWEDAYAQGDESPGGDNPTPDQNEVDLIGKAIGTEYADDQELLGGEEIVSRDRHRWELDPASSDDWPHDKKK